VCPMTMYPKRTPKATITIQKNEVRAFAHQRRPVLKVAGVGVVASTMQKPDTLYDLVNQTT